MRIALLTANIGGIDSLSGIRKQTKDFHYYPYFLNNLPYPLPNLNNRLKGKYVKIQSHRFLNHYDAYVWIDGRVEVIGESFIELMVKDLCDEKPVSIFKHKDRDNIYQEIEYIQSNIKLGNPYLTKRYANQNLESELEFYKNFGLKEDCQLYACTIFARLNNLKTNDAFDEWWRRILEFSLFDQTMFSYVKEKHKIKVNELDYSLFEDQFILNKHLINI